MTQYSFCSVKVELRFGQLYSYRDGVPTFYSKFVVILRNTTNKSDVRTLRNSTNKKLLNIASRLFKPLIAQNHLYVELAQRSTYVI
jgi:hypothetical protein